MRQKQRVFSLFLLSPSSRRAWIEMSHAGRDTGRQGVALLAEGVDRNLRQVLYHGLKPLVALLAEGVDRNAVPAHPKYVALWSPSSRRAWIEMGLRACAPPLARVALLAEGVDRNLTLCHGKKSSESRPPRGGRG